MAWTISYAKLPILPGANHIILIVRDDNGCFVTQFNGGPQGSDGRLASFDRDPWAFVPGARSIVVREHSEFQWGAPAAIASDSRRSDPVGDQRVDLWRGCRSGRGRPKFGVSSSLPRSGDVRR